MSATKARGFLTAAAIVVALCGCGRGPSPSEGPQPNLGAATPQQNASGAAVAGSSAPQARSARLDDPKWTRAMGEDAQGKQALADALGASGLVEALEDGGEIARVALEALPLAEDAEIALAPLVARGRGAKDADLVATLQAVLEIAGKPATAREALDPEGAAEAGAWVLSVATNESLPRETRAIAVSAARAFAEKKIVDGSKIPTSLDPP